MKPGRRDARRSGDTVAISRSRLALIVGQGAI
jgi:hypothetical protein